MVEGGREMFCSKCGNNLPDTAKFCDKCGNEIKKLPEEIAVHKRSKKAVVWLGGSLLIIACLCIMLRILYPIFRQEQVYDNNGNIIKDYTITYEDFNCKVYEYNEMNKCLKEAFCNEKTGETLVVWEIGYDGDGNEIEIEYDVLGYKVKEICYKDSEIYYIYKYDSEGNKIWEEDKWAVCEYKYDSEGNKIKETRSKNNDSDSLWITEWYSNGNISRKVEHKKWLNGEGYNIIEKKYTANGVLYEESETGTEDSKYKMLIQYDRNTGKKTYSYRRRDDGVYEYFHYYDKDGGSKYECYRNGELYDYAESTPNGTLFNVKPSDGR